MRYVWDGIVEHEHPIGESCCFTYFVYFFFPLILVWCLVVNITVVIIIFWWMQPGSPNPIRATCDVKRAPVGAQPPASIYCCNNPVDCIKCLYVACLPHQHRNLLTCLGDKMPHCRDTTALRGAAHQAQSGCWPSSGKKRRCWKKNKYISCKGKQGSCIPLKASGGNVISSEFPDKGKWLNWKPLKFCKQ